MEYFLEKIFEEIAATALQLDESPETSAEIATAFRSVGAQLQSLTDSASILDAAMDILRREKDTMAVYVYVTKLQMQTTQMKVEK